jgi:hypothetical protein
MIPSLIFLASLAGDGTATESVGERWAERQRRATMRPPLTLAEAVELFRRTSDSREPPIKDNRRAYDRGERRFDNEVARDDAAPPGP